MSHILLKQVPTSTITTPAATYVKFFSNFNDGGILYYMDDSGNPLPVGSGSTYNPVTEITYSALYALKTANGFATASYYLITDFDSVYDQPDFYCDGTPKTVVDNKGKPTGWGYQPILVLATSKNSLSPDAYQPSITSGGYLGFPKDKIKYDITWNKTEFNKNAKGRITERIDEFGNRTDYDHRTIRFRRYQNYVKYTQLTGVITDYNCTTGVVTGLGSSFSSELLLGSIIIIDSKADLGYDIGLKVGTQSGSIASDGSFTAIVDTLYAGGVPSSVPLLSGGFITTEDYSFSSKTYDFYSTTATGDYNQYKEVYFGQGDSNDCDKEIYTFQSGSVNNKIGNYSQVYLGITNNVFILPNNIFGSNCNNNSILDNFYNNQIGDNFFDNIIGYNFSKNFIGDNFSRNTTVDTFSSNLIGDNFKWNIIQTVVSSYDFTSATLFPIAPAPLAKHVYGNYNCFIFSNSIGFVRLSYYNSSDVLVVTDVDA
jgi:hypothetical protein